ncbi:hypothetical protein JOC55_004831 [Paenibacillus sacheonensis]|nr:hypothetical protein [Paenibacillus sacheonensis]
MTTSLARSLSLGVMYIIPLRMDTYMTINDFGL